MSTSFQYDKVGFETLSVISKAGHFNQWMYETIKPYLKGAILEIGSGIGNISQFLIQDGMEITLSDYDPYYQNYLKNKFQLSSNVKDIVSIDLQAPRFNEKYNSLKEKFDTVFLLNVIEHLKDDSAAVQNCKYLLQPGGRLIILAPAYERLYCRFDKELGHYRRYTKSTLKRLLEKNNLASDHSSYFNFLGIAGWLVFGKLLKKKAIGGGEMNFYNRILPFVKWMDKITHRAFGLSVIVVGQKNH